MKKSTKQGLGATGALLGAAAGAAGAYYFYGSKDAKKHRKDAGKWMKVAQKDVVAEAKKLKIALTDEKNYRKVAAIVAKRYQDVQKIGSKDVNSFVRDMAGMWKEMNATKKVLTKRVGNVTKSAAKTKKSAKKVAKKVSKKK